MRVKLRYTALGRGKELIRKFVKSGDILGFRGLGNQNIDPVISTAPGAGGSALY
jgi:hypothetical protein